MNFHVNHKTQTTGHRTTGQPYKGVIFPNPKPPTTPQGGMFPNPKPSTTPQGDERKISIFLIVLTKTTIILNKKDKPMGVNHWEGEGGRPHLDHIQDIIFLVIPSQF